MKVYIIVNSYQSDYETNTNIIDVFDSKEKAIEKLAECRKDDLEWIDAEELDEDTNREDYSFIQYDDVWSCLEIVEKEVL